MRLKSNHHLIMALSQTNLTDGHLKQSWTQWSKNSVLLCILSKAKLMTGCFWFFPCGPAWFTPTHRARLPAFHTMTDCDSQCISKMWLCVLTWWARHIMLISLSLSSVALDWRLLKMPSYFHTLLKSWYYILLMISHLTASLHVTLAFYCLITELSVWPQLSVIY